MDDIKKALDSIQKLIADGKLEEGYVELVRLLESSEEYTELADTARINQADMYTWKAQGLKGTLSGDESRRIASQLADNALKIVRQLETGKVYFEPEIKPHSSKAWRYYLTGGIGALVLATATYFFLNKETGDCPAFEDNFETRVMILPFLNAQNDNPEIDIMESLNEWIEQTPRLRNTAISAVHNGYDIEKQYPNSAQAVEVAQNCDAHMLVWGKVRTLPNNRYTLDVRYRLVNDGGVLAAGDTSINRLLSVTEEASLTSDAEAIGRMLYIALANYKRAPIAANLMAEMSKSAAVIGLTGDSLAQAPVDTSSSFILADQYYLQNQPEKAIAEYDKVLGEFPENSTALTKRGALMYQQGEYLAASRNFEAVAAPTPAAAPAFREASYKAY
ncbi:MAG: tetratricopeptide repeat protein, partial [Saprospiraceae bacterium]